ncbi:MAG: hypothetical protein FJ042_03805 [Candidatus Cloacimonetes bacterium]|nr:hypothetical protein [Candidatus Cloacimonadota bacterium]
MENADTGDIRWNVAQMEQVKTGKMHPYMRIYRCQRLLARIDGYVTAYEITMYLNNNYEPIAGV